jgi:phenylalanine-4-hydroxylase
MAETAPFGATAPDRHRPPSARADFTIAQDWSAYTREEHETWRLLFRRQEAVLERRACREFLAGMCDLGVAADAIPDFRRLNDVLHNATRWSVVAVPITL